MKNAGNSSRGRSQGVPKIQGIARSSLRQHSFLVIFRSFFGYYFLLWLREADFAGYSSAFVTSLCTVVTF